MTTNRLNDAIALARAGNKVGARQVLTEVIRAEPTNEAAWLWLADTYTTEDDRARILEQCIRTIPTGQMARKALSMLKSREKTAPRPSQISPDSRPIPSSSLSSPTSPISKFPRPVGLISSPSVPTEPPAVRSLPLRPAPPEPEAVEPEVEQLVQPEEPEVEAQPEPEVVETTIEEQPPSVPDEAEVPAEIEPEPPVEEIEQPLEQEEEAPAPEPVEPPSLSRRIAAPDMPFHVSDARAQEEQSPAAGGFQSFFGAPIQAPPPAREEPPPVETQPTAEEELAAGAVDLVGLPIDELETPQPEQVEPELSLEPTSEEESQLTSEPPLVEETLLAAGSELAEEILPEEEPALQDQLAGHAAAEQETTLSEDEPEAHIELSDQEPPAPQANYLEEDDTEKFLRSFGPVEIPPPPEAGSAPAEETLEHLGSSSAQSDTFSWMDSSPAQSGGSSLDWLEPPSTPVDEPAPQQQPADIASILGEGLPGEVGWLEDLRGTSGASAASGEKSTPKPSEFSTESSPSDRDVSAKVESWLTNIPEPKPWDEANAKPPKPLNVRSLTPPLSPSTPVEKPPEPPVTPATAKPEQEITLAPDDILLQQLRQEKPSPKPGPRVDKAGEAEVAEPEEKAAGTDWLTIALIAAFVLVVILAVGFYLVWSRIRDQNSALSTLVASTQYAIETRIAAPTDTPTPTITLTFSPTPLTPTMTFTPSTPTDTITPTLTPEDPLALSPKNASSFMPVTVINTGSGELAVSSELNYIAFWNPEDKKKSAKVDLWDLASGNLIVTLSGHTNKIRAATFSPNGRLLATGDEGGSIRLWDIPGGTQLFVMEVNRTRVNDLEFSPGGRFLASVTSDNTIRLWNTNNGTLLFALNFLGGQSENSPVPLNVAFSPNGRMVAAGTYGVISIWSTSDGSLLKTLAEGVTGWNVSFSPDSQQIAEAGDGYVGLWNTATGLAERRFPGANKSKGLPPNYAFSPDGSKLVIEGSVDAPQLALWDVAMGIQLKAFDGGWANTITGLFSPDGRVLAGFGRTEDQRFIAQLWDIETSTKLAGFENGFDLRFSPDGRRMLVRSGVIQLWTVPTAPVPGVPTPTP